MDTLQRFFTNLLGFAQQPWFSIGETQINILRFAGLILILLIVWWGGLLFEKTITRVGHDQKSHVNPSWYALSRIGRYIIWIIGFAIGLSYLGFNMASFSLIGGAIGVGVGFGLQNIISNFISGIIILVERIVKVNDFVDLQSGVTGRVIEINLRYTRVTTADSIDIIIPNSEFITGRVVNWTLGERTRRIHVPFGVAYGVDKTLVKEAAVAAAHSVKSTVSTTGREPDAWLVNFGDSSLDFELVVWVDANSTITPGRTHAQYLWAIDDELRKRNIEIPFPQRDLHIRSSALKNLS